MGPLLECMQMRGYLALLKVYMVAPAAIALVVVLVSLLRLRCASRLTAPALLETSLPALLQLIFLAYPLVTNTAFEAFSCHKFTDSEWLKVDVAIECGTAEHEEAQAYAVVAILVYPVGMLGLTGALLWRSRRAILSGKPTKLSTAIGFLHREYELHHFWWELVEMLRRFLLVGLMVLAQGSMQQLVLGTLFSAVFLLLQVRHPRR
jgi:hypothetical protein